MSKTIFSALIVLLFSFSLFAQNKFEGYNIIVDAPDTQKALACAIRYVAPLTQINITDLDSKTPMNLRPCEGSAANLSPVKTGQTTATIRADSANFKWCFNGEDKKYRISFVGDSFKPKVTYDWIATPETPGFYNIKDFGAVGDGKTDNTIAFQSAVAFIATRNGGTLTIPEGDFLVGNQPDFKGITLPSGITIQGAGGIFTGAPTNNVTQRGLSRVTLSGTNRAIFRIGECTQRVALRDFELYTDFGDNTYGVEAVGAFNSTQEISFDRMSFSNFFRGIYAHALEITVYQWQFDYIKVNQCIFIYNQDAGIWIKSKNSDWKITGSLFINPKKTETRKADSIYIYHSAAILVQDTFSGGFANAQGGDFISMVSDGPLTVIGSECEQMTRSMVFADFPQAGNFSYPITLVNNVFGNPIEVKGRRTLVSTGNLFGSDTFRADEWLRVYSTGDRFCYDGYIIGCQSLGANATRDTRPGQTAIPGFGGAKVVFRTGQPGEGTVPTQPTIFGTDVRFDSPIQLPSILQSDLSKQTVNNGTMVFCSNCKRGTSPCQNGGSGAPAMFINGRWECL